MATFKFRTLPPLYVLRQHFALDDEHILVNVSSRKRARKGMKAGSFDKINGRWNVTFKGVKYMRYRIVWALHNGRLPGRLTIDHINGDRADDRPENLRRATFGEQRINSQRTRRPGMKGVYPVERANGVVKYRVAICHGNLFRHIGTFKTLDRARAAYLTAAEEMEFADFLPADILATYSAAREAVSR